jgi:hypothetical protein
MSTKFEQLLDYLVNEEMDKANELFHEIVVEKSRDIYENLIAEEAEEEQQDESVDEVAESDDEEMEESADEEADESMDLEDSYMMDSDDEEGEMGGDAADDFGGDIGAMDSEEPGSEGGEEGAIFDIKNAIAELEAAFAELEQAKGMGGDDEFGGDDMAGDEMGPEMDDEENNEMMGQPAMEGRRLREYSEKVGNDWDKNSQKEQGKIVGANTGEGMPNAESGTKSPVSSGKGKPTTGATAGNILGDQKTGAGKNTGDRPDSLNKGIAQVSGEKFAKGIHNVDGVKSGIKTVSKQGAGYPGNNKTAGPVGSGTGDKAGQTSVSSDKPFLKKL